MARVGDAAGKALGLIGAITFWTTIPSVVALGGEAIQYPWGVGHGPPRSFPVVVIRWTLSPWGSAGEPDATNSRPGTVAGKTISPIAIQVARYRGRARRKIPPASPTKRELPARTIAPPPHPNKIGLPSLRTVPETASPSTNCVAFLELPTARLALPAQTRSLSAARGACDVVAVGAPFAGGRTAVIALEITTAAITPAVKATMAIPPNSHLRRRRCRVSLKRTSVS